MSLENTIHELTPEGFVDLFDIFLAENAGSIHITSKVGYTYKSVVYNELPCHMTSVGQRADAEMKRPRFTAANPKGVFSNAVDQRLLENGYVVRNRVLKSEIGAGLGVARKFRIARVANLTHEMIVMELRSMMDSGNFKFPSRTFIPPEFPYVRI